MNDDHGELEKKIRQESPGLLKNLPGEKKHQLLEFLAKNPTFSPLPPGPAQLVTMQTQVVTSGPVPPAELLEGYNRAIPNGADRLFTLVEEQSSHRQKIELLVVERQASRSDRGQIFGVALAILFGLLSGFFAFLHEPWLAGITLSTTIGSLVATFVLGQKNQLRNLDKKEPK